jgi:hypothetical protein
LHELPRAQIELPAHGDVHRLERLRVDLGEQHALREIEGRDDDRVVVGALTRRGAGARPQQAEGEEEGP